MNRAAVIRVIVGLAIVAAAVGLLAALIGVDATQMVLILVAGAAMTLFAPLYGVTAKWWTFQIGRALFVSSLSLMFLIDISLAYQWLGDDYFLRDVVRLAVFTGIAAGAVWKLYALIREKGWLQRLFGGRRH